MSLAERFPEAEATLWGMIAEPRNGRARVLLCEDNADLRALTASILEQAGYAVTSAADGEEGYHHFLDAPPDLLITDWHMPRLNGLDLILALRRLGHRQPIILVTGGDTYLHGHLEDIVVLRKPVPSATLLALTDAFTRPEGGSTDRGRARDQREE